MEAFILKTKNYKEFSISTSNIDIQVKDIVRSLPGDELEKGHGDRWTVKQRAEHPLLVGLLDVKSKYVYGMSSRGVPQYLFTPHNESYPQFIVGCSTKDKSINKIVLVRFESWNEGQKFPHGALVDTLGPSGNLIAEANALYWQHSPWQLNKLNCIPPKNQELLRENKVDISDKYTINIDPPGCKDIDDVISVYEDEDEDKTTTKTKPKYFVLVITIADVAETVESGNVIDIHAQKTGQSLYSNFLPPRNMLHPLLSEDRLSLLPGQKRYGLSLFIYISNEGNIIESKQNFSETIVLNKASFTYDTVVKNAPPDMVEKIRFAAKTLGCKECEDPHKWIETFMVFYNKEAAKLLLNHKVGIFRGQKESVKADLEKYRQMCPELAHEAAVYTDATNILPHYSMGLIDEAYCYASSPIRRYVDIINQRLLKNILNREWDLLFLHRDTSSEMLVRKLNVLQSGAKKQGRDDFFLSKLVVDNLQSKLVEGIVFSIGENKIRVFIPSWKRIISFHSNDQVKQEGKKISIKYYYNPNQVGWKNRFVFQIVEL